jgi:hypothetical protein
MRMGASFRALAAFLWCGLLGLIPFGPLDAQIRELSLEVGGSSVKPPVGVEGETAQFMVAGIRAMRYRLDGSGVMASFQAGRSLRDGSSGDYLSGTLEGVFWRYFAPGWSAGVEVRGFGFDVEDPYPYRALGVEGGPGVRYETRSFSASLNGVAGTGWSETELAPVGTEPATVLEEDLWRVGATMELLAGSQKIMGGVGAGFHNTPEGNYHSIGGRLLLRAFGPIIELMVDSWQTPIGRETTGGMALVLPVKGWTLRGFLGRTEPDPLTLSEPGGGGGGLMVGRRVLGSEPISTSTRPLHEVLDRSEDFARVRFRVRPPRGTEKVELMGDFTFWEAVPMTRDGDVWALEMEVPDGIHHFGFLTDEVWYIPEDAPDAVADEWGRKNATLVIER